MSDEARAEWAKRLLEDATLNEALDAIKMNAFEKWAESDPCAYDKRDAIYSLVGAVELLKTQLRCYLEEGVVEREKARRRGVAGFIDRLRRQ